MTQPRRASGQFSPTPAADRPHPSRATTARHDTSPAAEADVSTCPTPGEWVRWHALELLAVSVPVLLAVWVSAWLLLLAVPVTAVWAAGERRATRQRSRPDKTGE